MERRFSSDVWRGLSPPASTIQDFPRLAVGGRARCDFCGSLLDGILAAIRPRGAQEGCRLLLFHAGMGGRHSAPSLRPLGTIPRLVALRDLRRLDRFAPRVRGLAWSHWSRSTTSSNCSSIPRGVIASRLHLDPRHARLPCGQAGGCSGKCCSRCSTPRTAVGRCWSAPICPTESSPIKSSRISTCPTGCAACWPPTKCDARRRTSGQIPILGRLEDVAKPGCRLSTPPTCWWSPAPCPASGCAT